MPDSAIHEMIAAFATGSMDRSNYAQFKDYLTSGGKLPAGELGELQNLMALIPTILETETPPPELKSKVAKDLMKLQGEIKQKIVEKKKASKEMTAKTVEKNPAAEALEQIKKGTAVTSEKPSEKPLEKTKEDEKPPDKTTGISRKDFLPSREDVLGHEDEKSEEKPKTEESTGSFSFGADITSEEKATNNDVKTPASISRLDEPPRITQAAGPPIANIRDILEDYDPGFTRWNRLNLYITSVIALVILIFMFLIYSKINSHIDDFNRDFSLLKSDAQVSSRFIKKYGPLVEFFNYNAIKAYNLIGTDTAPGASAKLLMAFDEGEGLLKVNNLFTPQGDDIYQLWMQSQGSYYSLLKFKPTAESEFMKLDSYPFIPADNIAEFRITIEPKSGSERPTGNTVMLTQNRRRK